MPLLSALLFVGPEDSGVVPSQVARVRQAAALDIAHQLAGLPAVERVVVVTPLREWAEEHSALPVAWDFDSPGRPFHFGERLSQLVQARGLERVLYLGAASMPLLGTETVEGVLAQVSESRTPLAVTNNLHSSDWIVFNHAQRVLALAARLPLDNALGWVLSREGGFEVRALPASAATRLDLDTPADVLALGLQPGLAGHLAAAARRFLDEHSAAWTRYRRAVQTLFRPGSQVILAGRVSSAALEHLESHTQVWLRVYAEERGMSASRRLAEGKVRSLLAYYLEAVGTESFFAVLGALGDAAFLDTRVLMAHRRLWPSASDRYASDLLEPEGIADDWLRSFTRAAAGAPFPVALGGHGLVSGGLYAIVAAAQAGAFEQD